MSDKKYPTRMHEVLGVEAKEDFIVSFPGDGEYQQADFECFVDDGGNFKYKKHPELPPSIHIINYAINHGITRRPRQEDDDANKGLYSKYKVTKADGTPLDGDCFILRPDRDKAAISALEAYADATNNEKLAADIREWLQTPRRPRLSEEQVRQLRALMVFDKLWISKDKDGSVFAFKNKPERDENNAMWIDRLYEDAWFLPGTSALADLVSWSDPEPLDIVATLKAAGVEVEE